MPREGKAGYRQNGRKKINSQNKGSEESDEDYIAREDEDVDDLDEYCSSLEEDESEETSLEFEEEEEENVKKVVRPKKTRKGHQSKRTNQVKRLPKRRRVAYRGEDGEEKEEEEEDYEEEEEEEKEKDYEDEGVEQDDNDYDDEEFTPDEIGSLDDDEEFPVRMKNKRVGRPPLRKMGFAKRKKRKRNSKVLKKAKRKKTRNTRRLRKVRSSSNNGRRLTARKLGMAESSKKISTRSRKRSSISDSDSDFASSGSSDYEYTISEEEREQVREASEFCQSLTTTLRSSLFSRRLQKEEQDRKVVLHHQRKRSERRKGKEKVEDLKTEVCKQVCGICLSEEDQRTLRGTLNCCSHYFCIACIMEWSKVESRCPICKQRFVTISKPARSSTVFDLRTVVIPVPERDQVYQPSEEELRGYLDPYENVICTECQQGGDDALMLLCDLCDSPAHTYCVGLGHEVPEGNWYCEGCRPTALSSSNMEGLNPEHRTSNLFGGLSQIGREGFDLNVAYVPDVPSTQEIFSSARRSSGDMQTASPSSGSGAVTVSDRRRIQRQIHHLISNRMRQSSVRRSDTSAIISGNSLFSAQIDQLREAATRHMVTPERVASNSLFFEGRLQNNTTSFMQNRENFSARASSSRDHFIQNPTYTSASGGLPAELAGISRGINSRQGYDQFLPFNTRSNIGSDSTMSTLASREGSHLNVEMEQVQAMVRSHLKSLSRDMELGRSAFSDIARCCTHTILAACGLEHQRSEVYPVDPPTICHHTERVAVGQRSVLTGHCPSCFDLFVRNVVGKLMISRVP